MTAASVAVIGGTGMNTWPGFEGSGALDGDNAWGSPSAPLQQGRFADTPVLFLARHGQGHHIPPHRINFRANLQALADAGVRRVIAAAAVGSMNEAVPPGALALPEDCIDYTWGRAHSYSDGPDLPLHHIGFTEPFSPLRERMLEVATAASVPIHPGGVLGVTQGPRLETAAEVRRLRRDGCDLVGMTTMPEAALARELGLDYTVVAVCVNWAAGVGSGDIHGEIERYAAEGMDRLRQLLTAVLPVLAEDDAR
ncbi:MAG: S-methyl-5'-thioinosine phosphorylase [Proteobacteria bacterium]|nr:S-methyl-5'-thioinosine phosphorylase [Pseudomonadota bacterium]